MIIVRDIFQLKFGKAKEAKELIKAGREITSKAGYKLGRAMTDLTGKSYTLVLETEFKDLTDFQNALKDIFSNNEWQQWYKKIVPLIDSASREMYTAVD